MELPPSGDLSDLPPIARWIVGSGILIGTAIAWVVARWPYKPAAAKTATTPEITSVSLVERMLVEIKARGEEAQGARMGISASLDAHHKLMEDEIGKTRGALHARCDGLEDVMRKRCDDISELLREIKSLLDRIAGRLGV